MAKISVELSVKQDFYFADSDFGFLADKKNWLFLSLIILQLIRYHTHENFCVLTLKHNAKKYKYETLYEWHFNGLKYNDQGYQKMKEGP